MGQSIVDRTVSRLREGNFRAAAACPGEKIPALADIAVAVALHEVDLGEKMAVLEVSVLAPASLGAQGCQTAALAVGQLLQNDGASCTQDACEFDGLAGLFCVRILARYAGTAYPDDWTERAGFSVNLGEQSLGSLISFTARRVSAGEETGLAGAVWEFQLEEFFRPEDTEPGDVEEPFTLRMFRPLQTETFRECRWTEQQRVTEQTGTRQIRKGTATSRAVSVYA